MTSPEPSTLTDFIEAFDEYTQTTRGYKCYRGQRNSTWPNIAGIFRHDLTKLQLQENRAIRDLISIHPHEFLSDETMFDKLVRMQHFGLPTRLLDVSINALIALYFATNDGPNGEKSDGVVTAFAVPPEREKYFDSDSVSCLANLANMSESEKDKIFDLRPRRNTVQMAKDMRVKFNEEPVVKRLHQFIRAEKPYFLSNIEPIDLFKPYFVRPKMSNRRILAQSGAFIIYGIKPEERIKYHHPIVETKFVVPCICKAPIRSKLGNLGINESTLFPEIDKAAKLIIEKYTKY